MTINEDKVSPEFLPAYANWLCEFSLPYFDKLNDKFVERYLPYHPIGIMHLAGLDDIRSNKNILYKIKTTEGEILEKSLRFNS